MSRLSLQDTASRIRQAYETVDDIAPRPTFLRDDAEFHYGRREEARECYPARYAANPQTGVPMSKRVIHFSDDSGRLYRVGRVGDSSVVLYYRLPREDVPDFPMAMNDAPVYLVLYARNATEQTVRQVAPDRLQTGITVRVVRVNNRRPGYQRKASLEAEFTTPGDKELFDAIH
jgi:hypothetical protein